MTSKSVKHLNLKKTRKNIVGSIVYKDLEVSLLDSFTIILLKTNICKSIVFHYILAIQLGSII